MKIDINGIRLFYADQGSGCPILFLHGFPLDHTIWNPVIPLLKDKARLILPDLRGHGQTDSPDSIYSMATIAEDMVRLLDGLGLEKAILVGHSMGGYAALAFAHLYPDRLVGLCLAATQAAADSTERKAGRYATIQEVEQIGTGKLADGMSARLTSRPELVARIRRVILGTTPIGIRGSLMGMAERPDMTAHLAEIKVPAVVIAGELDQINPLEKSEEMARLLPEGHLVLVPGAGHMPMLEAPEWVAEAILGLIRPDQA